MADNDSCKPPSKLTRTKQMWAHEGRFLTGRTARPESERLPPGQHLVNDWPVLDLGQSPAVKQDHWRLDVSGAVDYPRSWAWAEFRMLPESRFVSDIHCVTTWSRFDNRWDGVAARDLLALVGPRASARFVILHSYDGYTTNIPIEDFGQSDVILAYSWNGAPLTGEHGGPLRLVVPHLYFWKSAKWVSRIEFAVQDHPGFWETRGYHDRGDPWREERYSP